MTAFMQAWNLLKAFEEDKGYYGTLPPAVRQLLNRKRAEAGEEGLGDVQHMRRTLPAQFEGTGDDRQMVSPVREVDMPSEAGDMREMPGGEMEQFAPERVPKTNLRVARDMSPLREMRPTMTGHHADQGPESKIFGNQTGMANVRGYDTMPEESFHTPREKKLIREGMEQSAGRQLTGGQRGGRTDITGGGRSGLFLPMRGEKDGGPVSQDIRTPRRGGERMRHTRPRRQATLSNVEGVKTGAQLGGASSQFVDEPEDAPEPTQQERIADLLSGMATSQGGSFENLSQEPAKETKPVVPRNEQLRPMSNRFQENLAQVRRGEKPYLDIPMDEETMGMFRDGAMPPGMQERLMRFAQEKGQADGSESQNQIDRTA
jgi:hypothetical protein